MNQEQKKKMSRREFLRSTGAALSAGTAATSRALAPSTTLPLHPARHWEAGADEEEREHACED